MYNTCWDLDIPSNLINIYEIIYCGEINTTSSMLHIIGSLTAHITLGKSQYFVAKNF